MHIGWIFSYIIAWLTQSSHVTGISAASHIAYLSNIAVLPERKHRSQNALVYYDLLEDQSDAYPPIEVTTARYPPYPYYDAPRNLFFDGSSMPDNDQHDDAQSTGGSANAHLSYMKNTEKHRAGENPDNWDSSPIAEFDRTLGKDYRDYIYDHGSRHRKEQMTTDVAEYDARRPGIAPWPSYEELRNEGLAVNTSLYVSLDPGHPLEKHLIGKPMIRNDIKTLGEARAEQKRWLNRSYHQEWPLSYEEFSALPQDMREAYYANRYKLCDGEERFLMVLQYRRSIGKAGDKMHPMEFRYMEDSYTYTPKESPVLQDLKNWDDPLEAPWRHRVEEAIRDCVAYGWPPEDIRFHTSFDVYDVTWLVGLIKIVIHQTRDEGGPITSKELKLMLMKLEKRLETLDEEEHTESIKNHVLMLVFIPNKRSEESRKELICRRDWNANIGKQVTVTFSDAAKGSLEATMLGSHSTLGIDLEIDGRRQTLPLNFIREIKLL